MFLYNILFSLTGVLVLPFLAVRALRAKQGHMTILKRLYPRVDMPQFPKRPIWIHALSVGEVLSSAMLVAAIKERHRDRPLVCSVSTQSGYEMARKSLAKDIDFIFFFPYDFVWSLRAVVRRVDPWLFVLIETDLWPNCLDEIRSRGVPIILVNGRLSPHSYRNYRRVSYFMKSVLSNISVICTQSEIDAKRFLSIGAAKDKVIVTGNLKFDHELSPLSETEVKDQRASMGIGTRERVFLAGSTHEGEEKILLNVYMALKKNFPDLVLVVAPRDPNRAYGIHQMFAQAGCQAFFRTELDAMDAPRPSETIIVDTMGDLRRLYAVADVVFIGKSLVNLGGQNPLEPAAFKKPILFGPHMFNFALISRMLIDQGGAVRVANEKDLLAEVTSLLLDTERSKEIGMKAHEVLCRNRGAVEKTLNVIERFM